MLQNLLMMNEMEGNSGGSGENLQDIMQQPQQQASSSASSSSLMMQMRMMQQMQQHLQSQQNNGGLSNDLAAVNDMSSEHMMMNAMMMNQNNNNHGNNESSASLPGKPNSALLNHLMNNNSYNKFSGLQNIQAKLGNPESGLFNTSSSSDSLGNLAAAAGMNNRMGSANGLNQMGSASRLNRLGSGNGLGPLDRLGSASRLGSAGRLGSGLSLNQMQNAQMNLQSMQNSKFPSQNGLMSSAAAGAAATAGLTASLSNSNFNWSLSNNSLAGLGAVGGNQNHSFGSINSMSNLLRGGGVNPTETASIPQRNASWTPMTATSMGPGAAAMAGLAHHNSTGGLTGGLQQIQGQQQRQQQPRANDPYSQNGLLGPWSAASAELLGDLMLSQGQGKKPRKKQKDKPKRPLSAYNIFFKEERQRILEDIPDKEAVDGQKKPMKRKGKKTPHGKIDFQSLAKTIGKRWQELSEEELEVYKHKSEADKLRYKKEMEQYIVTAGENKEA